ncbi:DUF616 domain-containing protein [Pseudoscourfieldia marina]
MRAGGLLDRFDSCPVVVLSASFGAQDFLYPALGVRAESIFQTVCFVTFVDDASVRAWRLNSTHTQGVLPIVSHTQAGVKTIAYQVRQWTVLRWASGNGASGLLEDSRRLARLIKTLAHIIFPCALYTIWVDTKYQLRMHPLFLLEEYLHLERESKEKDKSSPFASAIQLVVGKHPQRTGILSEIDALKGKLQLRGTVNITALDAQRATYVAEGVERYGPQGMSDTALLIRLNAASTVQHFGCAWNNELRVFDHTRDQPSFQYLLSKWFVIRGANATARVIDRCVWTRSYIEHGHNIRHGSAN